LPRIRWAGGFQARGGIGEHRLEAVSKLIEQPRRAPRVEFADGLIESRLLAGQQLPPIPDLARIPGRLDLAAKPRLGRGQVVDCSEPILNSLDGRIQTRAEFLRENSGNQLHGVAELLAADAKLMESRLIRSLGRSGCEELIDNTHELPSRPFAELLSGRDVARFPSSPETLQELSDPAGEAVLLLEAIEHGDDIP
jgi:hypothetical protein